MSDYVSLSFSPDNFLSISTDNNKANIYEYEFINKNIYDIEIDEKMKERAIKNYGVQEFYKNSDLIIINENKNELDVKYLWQWLDCKYLKKKQNKTIF
jgi:hypothetical protein